MLHRFSLSVLLLLCLVAFGCNAGKPKDDTPPPPKDNADAVAKLEHSGAKLTRDETTGNVVTVDFREADPNGADLLALRGLVEVKRLLLTGCKNIQAADISVIGHAPTIEVLDLRGCEVTNEALAELAPLTKLRALQLNSAQSTVNDDGLADLAQFENMQVLGLDGLWVYGDGLSHLTGLTKLRELTLGGTPINDVDIPTIIQFPQLERLRLSQTQITDESLALLPRLTKLKDLDISEVTTISDAGMEHIGQMTQLERLNLWRAPLSNAGVEHLAPLVNLKWLNLDNTGLTDDGMPALADMTQLEFLHLGSTGVSDAGLVHLEGMSNLQELWASRSGVTTEGAAELQKTLPECDVILEYGDQ